MSPQPEKPAGGNTPWFEASGPPAPEPKPAKAPPRPAPPPPARPTSERLVIGVKPPAPTELPDARKLLEKTANVLGGFLSPLKSKLAAMQAGETRTPPAAPPA